MPVIGGQEQPFTYGELQAEMDLLNRAYLEVMEAGDYRGRVFTFPIPTYNITHDFAWQSDNAERLFALTAHYGLPYCQNFLNSDLEPHMVRSMCCRLQLDLSELLTRGNGLFGSAEQTGSLGVVTINCARLGQRFAGDRAGMYAELDLAEKGVERYAIQVARTGQCLGEAYAQPVTTAPTTGEYTLSCIACSPPSDSWNCANSSGT